jgi:hypothetical protein
MRVTKWQQSPNISAIEGKIVLLEIVIRFFIGGAVVCIFALIGELLRPKSFAGIFGAAPSVALATLGLTFLTHGGSYAGLEGRSMLLGAFALLVYSLVTGWLVTRRELGALVASSTSMVAWLVVALGLWGALLR